MQVTQELPTLMHMAFRYKEEDIRSKESGSGFSGSPNNVGAEAVKRFLLRSCFIAIHSYDVEFHD